MGAEVRSFELWAGHFAEQVWFSTRAQNAAALQISLNVFYVGISELPLFGMMGSRLRHQISLSGFLAFSAALGQLQAALLTFISQIPDLLTIVPIYQRLRPVLVEATEVHETRRAIALTGEIEVRNISFRYRECAFQGANDVRMPQKVLDGFENFGACSRLSSPERNTVCPPLPPLSP